MEILSGEGARKLAFQKRVMLSEFLGEEQRHCGIVDGGTALIRTSHTEPVWQSTGKVCPKST